MPKMQRRAMVPELCSTGLLRGNDYGTDSCFLPVISRHQAGHPAELLPLSAQSWLSPSVLLTGEANHVACGWSFLFASATQGHGQSFGCTTALGPEKGSLGTKELTNGQSNLVVLGLSLRNCLGTAPLSGPVSGVIPWSSQGYSNEMAAILRQCLREPYRWGDFLETGGSQRSTVGSDHC